MKDHGFFDWETRKSYDRMCPVYGSLSNKYSVMAAIMHGGNLHWLGNQWFLTQCITTHRFLLRGPMLQEKLLDYWIWIHFGKEFPVCQIFRADQWLGHCIRKSIPNNHKNNLCLFLLRIVTGLGYNQETTQALRYCMAINESDLTRNLW